MKKAEELERITALAKEDMRVLKKKNKEESDGEEKA